MDRLTNDDHTSQTAAQFGKSVAITTDSAAPKNKGRAASVVSIVVVVAAFLIQWSTHRYNIDVDGHGLSKLSRRLRCMIIVRESIHKLPSSASPFVNVDRPGHVVFLITPNDGYIS